MDEALPPVALQERGAHHLSASALGSPEVERLPQFPDQLVQHLSPSALASLEGSLHPPETDVKFSGDDTGPGEFASIAPSEYRVVQSSPAADTTPGSAGS
jgi:hypothetical protein